MNRLDHVRRLSLAAFALALSIGAGACASGGSGGSSGEDSRDVITAEDLAGLRNMTAYEAVRRLKPTWLRTRGRDSFRGSSSITVMVNGTRMGGLGTLSSYQIRDVQEIRYLDRREATMKYGTITSGGAIEVTLVR